MKFKNININKAVLSGYSDEQLQDWAESNGLNADDAKELKGKLGKDEAPAGSTPEVNSNPGPGSAAPEASASGSRKK